MVESGRFNLGILINKAKKRTTLDKDCEGEVGCYWRGRERKMSSLARAFLVREDKKPTKAYVKQSFSEE